MKRDFLYELLPAIYRQRDFEGDGSLRALLDVLQSQFDLLHDDISGLYDDWFVETCRPWVVPYLGDLLNQPSAAHVAAGSRRLVANALGYRRSKGTAAALENAIFDATGWRAKVVELFRALGQTSHLAHLQPNAARTALLRGAESPALGGAFATAAHTADFRSPPTLNGGATPGTRGRFHPGRVAIHLWRLPVAPVSAGIPRALDAGSGRWTFHPLGVDVPLVHRPPTPTTPLRTGIEPPLRLTRRTPAVLLPRIWSASRPDLELACTPCDLSEWKMPLPSTAPSGVPQEVVAVDPILGRFLLPHDLRGEPNDWRVDFAFHGNTDLGGGPYPRPAAPPLPGPEPWKAWVLPAPAQALPAEIEAALHALHRGDHGQTYPTLQAALAAWQDCGRPGHIFLPENFAATSGETLAIAFQPGRGAALTIEAAGNVCATFRGPWNITAESVSAQLRLVGLWLEGPLQFRGDIALELSHCTLLPSPRPSITALPHRASDKAQVTLFGCVSGALSLPGAVGTVSIHASIIDGAGGPAIDLLPDARAPFNAAAPILTLKYATVLGSVSAGEAHRISSSIVTGPLRIHRAARRSIRYSFFPLESHAPGQSECQPAKALADSVHTSLDPTTAVRLAPSFTALRFGQPGYARLALRCPPEILGGAEDGDEMGAFHGAARLASEFRLQAMLDEYLPLGLTPVVFHET